MKIVCMGDSLTEGYEISKDSRWTTLLDNELDVEIVNSGISGDLTCGMLSRFKDMVLSHNPTHVIIMGGTNDIKRGIPIEIIVGNIIAMTRYAKFHNIISIIGIPTYVYEILGDTYNGLFLNSKDFSENIKKYRNYLIEFSKEDDKMYIDFGQGLSESDYLDDMLHPNEKGHIIMKDNAKKVICSIGE